MRKTALLFIMSIIIVSCVDKYQSNLDKMGNSIKSEIENLAFKNNGKVVFHSFEPIGYDTVSALMLDTMNLIALSDLGDKLLEYGQILNGQSRKQLDLMQLYRSSGMEDLKDMQGRDVKETLEKYDLVIGKLKELAVEDSLIRAREGNNKEPGSLYLARVFIKASFEDGKESLNSLDTIQYFFDKELNLILPTDYSRFEISNLK